MTLSTQRPGSRLTITPPADYLLSRDACSYGYCMLAPNRWVVSEQALETCLHITTDDADGGVGCIITQPDQRTGGPLQVRTDARLDAAQQRAVKAQIRRMLRLDESAEDIAAFHSVDDRWRESGRGRLIRTPTLFEDIITTVTNCNVTWPGTINMNRRLCEVLGARSPSGLRAFPTARRMARTRPGTLRGRCRVGYRDQRMVDLAKLFVRGEVDEAWLGSASTTDDEVYRFLLKLPGIGPYAAGNIMQLLGRYSRLALDTESVRHGKTVLGMTGSSPAILKRLERHYEAFGEHKFRSYWLELWTWYESQRGPAHLWDRDEMGKTFTASHF